MKKKKNKVKARHNRPVKKRNKKMPRLRDKQDESRVASIDDDIAFKSPTSDGQIATIMVPFAFICSFRKDNCAKCNGAGRYYRTKKELVICACASGRATDFVKKHGAETLADKGRNWLHEGKRRQAISLITPALPAAFREKSSINRQTLQTIIGETLAHSGFRWDKTGGWSSEDAVDELILRDLIGAEEVDGEMLLTLKEQAT